MSRALFAALAVVILSGCLRERDRLDVPRVTLELEDSIVFAGYTVRGRAWAVDGTGLIFFQVTAETSDSISGDRRSRISVDSVLIEFALPVSGQAQVDERVIIEALARDNQEFEITATDTIYVRARQSPP